MEARIKRTIALVKVMEEVRGTRNADLKYLGDGSSCGEE
jgi:hypothetical protein